MMFTASGLLWQNVRPAGGWAGAGPSMRERGVHFGIPFPYLRDGSRHSRPAGSDQVNFELIREWNYTAMVLDGVVALIMVSLAGAVFEGWVRRWNLP